MGDSDIAGDVSVTIGEKRLFILADLTSQNIDLDDFGPMIGLAPDIGPGETASLAQEKEAKSETASPFVLPNEPIDIDGLKNINAKITLRSKHVESKLPVDDLFMQIVIDDGHLVLAPLNFGIATGNVRSRIEIDTTTQLVKSKLETEIRHIRLNEVLRRFEVANESTGIVGGQGTFWFEGDSMAKMLASADGCLLILITSSWIWLSILNPRI